jgi:hypothetical protein
MKPADELQLATTLCARCGHEERLIVRTTDGSVSRCYVCGDETLNLRATPTRPTYGWFVAREAPRPGRWLGWPTEAIPAPSPAAS